ncbi:MAG: hypothetical protein AAFW89_06185 [Bacteroidota bacterium]
MKIRFVSRDQIRSTRKKASKYSALIDALGKLKPGGDALQVQYTNDKEISSIRNLVYAFNRETGKKVKSRKDTANKTTFFYLK